MARGGDLINLNRVKQTWGERVCPMERDRPPVRRHKLDGNELLLLYAEAAICSRTLAVERPLTNELSGKVTTEGSCDEVITAE
ncbi:hypothetical protein Q1695_005025 [Nippostrongylus brasiliensis]|nr:hypothetical protein Q1695_005025 [Nippostrongylus brasiliensis]